MKRLVWIAVTFFTAASLVGCVKQHTTEEQNALAARVQAAVLDVPGISGGEVGVSRANELASLSIGVWLTSNATTKEELLTVLEDVARSIYDSLGDIERGMLYISVSNGIDEVSHRDLGDGFSTIQELRQYFEE